MTQEPHPLIGVSQDIIKISELVKHVADTKLNVVISGETGVGKEVVAQNLYTNSDRKGKPFVKINCAALPDGLLESELYGYEQGAFTGAARRKRGKFELANKGVLFLDEIGEMPLLLQSKLLHVLQTGEFSPLGSEKELKTDTWVIAATNHDLKQDVINKKFREDLYYRLSIINIDVPPLRNRPEDIPPIIDYYMQLYTAKYNKKNITRPKGHILDTLISYQWPGNVRELQNILKKMMVMTNWDSVLTELIRGRTPMNASPSAHSSQQSSDDFSINFNINDELTQNLDQFSLKQIRKRAVDKIEKQAIEYVLNETNWNRSKAAKILKINYKTLLYKIDELNLIPPEKK